VVELDALIEAAKAGDESGVRALIAETPRLAVQRLPSGESPLMAALYRGHHAVVDALIELGAEVDVFTAAATGRLPDLARALVRPEAVNAYAHDGWTPLHLAAFFGRLDAARMLLDAGANLHAVSRNSLRNTPLHAAAAGKHSAIALLLQERGADRDALDGGGYTPQQIAAENKLVAVIEAMDRTSDL
jgi:ankyrin repeat protein